MPKLNQIVAVEKGLKSRTATAVTKIYHDLQKPALFAGLSRKYTPIDDDGEKFPPESTLVQKNVDESLRTAASELTQLFDTVATKEEGNRHATADVVVDGTVVVPGASVPLLLFLEKQLADIRTVISKVPTLDPSESWSPDDTSGGHRTEPVQTTRTRKVPRTLVKYEATERHPAQTEVYMVDEMVGHWATTKFSGALSPARRDVLAARVDALSDAVKKAREEANSTEVNQVHVGEAVFQYLLR
ncbi:DUF7873 family protein [Streptomyces hydrogenans]|uniref:Uncharacterized protein n=1 Tax=Streptomyces hydrogenans TaxID=1873719 RepID=A0ABQ3PJD5_9ACTN|nr:hypothetical protein [Streptomyces hydrogenans]GHF94388.1 hypothetical protein GCM10018784_02570 [Streptomyces hydrogenans]GHI25131.1 hypothetical protein Shyd_65020 [Streptomyces hydrogenans]